MNLKRKHLFGILCVACIIGVTLCIALPLTLQPDDTDKVKRSTMTLLQYFSMTDGIDIKWAHAVNSKQKLKTALEDSETDMLEADILKSVNGKPIMAHPPVNASDITLAEWLKQVYGQDRKGLKLDFKETTVVAESIEILRHRKKMSGKNLPVLLNADILPGPNNNHSKPVDAQIFLEAVKSIKNVIVSPGWKTDFVKTNSGEPVDNSGYSWQDVQAMYKLVKDIDLYITFPVRASLVSKSSKQLLWLLNQNKQLFSLTVWTFSKDTIDLRDLSFLRQYKDEVYFDMPPNEIEQIRKF